MDTSALIRIEQHAAAVVATEYRHLPSSIVSYYLTPPAVAIALNKQQLTAVLSRNLRYRRQYGLSPRNVSLSTQPSIQQQDYLPKLGVVSWKDCIGMDMLPKALLLPNAQNTTLTCWLNNVSDRMAMVLHAYRVTEETPTFYLFPYLDFSKRSEYRLAVSYGELTHVRCYRRRNDFQAQHIEVIAAWWRNIKDWPPADVLAHLFVDVVAGSDPGQFCIIDVNPNLSAYH
ncbi:hypothetical protein P4S70_01560 [Enterovibrio sp. Hal110]